MEEPEVPINGMKELTRTGQGQTEPKDPVLGSGRPQSEMSRKQKEGYSQHTPFSTLECLHSHGRHQSHTDKYYHKCMTTAWRSRTLSPSQQMPGTHT